MALGVGMMNACAVRCGGRGGMHKNASDTLLSHRAWTSSLSQQSGTRYNHSDPPQRPPTRSMPAFVCCPNRLWREVVAGAVMVVDLDADSAS